ncbi:ENV2 protein, partial [Crocuta crocuta]
MVHTFKVLNSTRPDLTESCWLCYNPKPPYYEGIATLNQYSTSNTSSECRWQQANTGRLILQSIMGQVPASHSHLCSHTEQILDNGYIIPPNQGWWACSMGLTPCVHSAVLNHNKDFCVLVQLVPLVVYHANEEIITSLNGSSYLMRTRREPITALTLTVLLGLGVTGAGTSISALATQSKNYQDLRMAIDTDIQNLENSIAHLQESLTSLAEVVLQNRRGLDLLFLQQGGLCAA